MNKQIKKALSAVLSLAMIAGSAIVPMSAGADSVTWDASATSWKFDFGAGDAVADGYIGVSADTKYDADKGFGFLGLENGYAVDALADDWTMTQGYDLTLENGARDTVTTADDDFVACTYDESVGNTGMISPIRFAMKSPETTYYTIKIKLQRADVSKEARVNLFTERRHQHLLDYPIPAEGMEYECSVYVHNWWDKNSGEKHDTMLNIVALGENVAVSSIEVTKSAEAGKTLFVLTDSTGCEQTAGIPYFPLDHCQGVGSALAKYLGKDWAIVNEGQSGLSSGASTSHFNNCKNHIKSGDVLWVQFGHNNAKTNGGGTEGLKSSLDTWYSAIPSDAYLIVTSPIERKQEYQYNAETKTWNYTLRDYATAGKEWVDAKIAAGKTNVAFIDLNKASVDFLGGVAQEVEATCNYGWKCANFYFFLNDYTHPNDYGADNFAKCAVNEANATIASDPASAQAQTLAYLLDGQRELEANRVPQSVYSLGLVPNSAYPKALTKVVYYDFPWLLKKVVWNDDGTADKVTFSPSACEKDIPQSYCKGVIEVFDSEGTSKGKIITADFFDRLNGDGSLEFDDAALKYDASAGDTYKAYLIDGEADAQGETIVSNTLTERDNIDVIEYLFHGSLGTENKEDFSTYTDVATGESLSGKGGWSQQGNVSVLLGKENGATYAAVKKTDTSQSHYLYKNLTKAVSDGKLYFNFDIRYKDGQVNIEFTDGSKAPNNFPIPNIMPLVIKTVDGEAGVYLSGELVSNINVGSWVNITYTLDLDRAVETASVNGVTKEKAVAAFDTEGIPSPSKLATLAIVETTKKIGIEYDITNIVIAKIASPELPEYEAAVTATDAQHAAVSIGEISALKYEDGKAVVAAGKACTLIEAKYDGSGKLSEVKTTPIETGKGSVPVAAGSKLMLWDGVNGMTPLANAVDAAEGGNKYTLNSNMTASVTVDDGYVFMGWYKGDVNDADNLVSMDAAYSFRLRGDTTLTAKIVKEPGIEDVVDFKITPSAAGIKAKDGATFNVAISDIVDENDTPLSNVTAEDAEWSCDTEGITVEKGVVKIGSGFALGSGEVSKNVTISATINNVKKSCKVNVYIYDYMEDFSGSDVASTGWFVFKRDGDGNADVSIVDGALKMQSKNNNNNNYIGVHFAAADAVADKIVTITFDYKVSSTSTNNNYYSSFFLSDTASNTPNYNDGVSVPCNAENLNLAANTNYTITVVANNKAKTIEVSAQPASGNPVTFSIDNVSRSINTLFFRPGRNITDMVDNVVVVISDAE